MFDYCLSFSIEAFLVIFFIKAILREMGSLTASFIHRKLMRFGRCSHLSALQQNHNKKRFAYFKKRGGCGHLEATFDLLTQKEIKWFAIKLLCFVQHLSQRLTQSCSVQIWRQTQAHLKKNSLDIYLDCLLSWNKSPACFDSLLCSKCNKMKRQPLKTRFCR